MNRSRLFAAATAPFGFLAVAALLAAVLAYPVYLMTDDSIGYRSLVSRGSLLIVLAGTYWIARHFHLNQDELGFAATKRGAFIKVATGLLLGIAMLGLHTLALLALDVREMDPRFLEWSPRWLATLGKSLAIGLAVGITEELMFRGVLLEILRKSVGLLPAVLISSFYYAILHFLRSDWKPRGLGLDWTTGFRILGDSVAQLAHLPADAFLALFLGGIFLACVRSVFPGGLAYCMGLHAGWVTVIKSAKSFSNGGPETHWSLLASDFDGVIGYLVAAWISLLTLPLLPRVMKNGAKPYVP